MSPEGQTGSDVVEATLPLAGDAAVDLALERVQLRVVRVQFALELGHAQAQPLVLAEERGDLLLEFEQSRGAVRFVLGVLKAERVEHEVERLALAVGDAVASWIHRSTSLMGWVLQDQIRSDQASGASPRKGGTPVRAGLERYP